MSTLIFNTKYENSEGIGDFECNLPKKLFFVKKKSAFDSLKMHSELKKSPFWLLIFAMQRVIIYYKYFY